MPTENSQSTPRKITRWVGGLFVVTCIGGLLSWGIYYVPSMVLTTPIKNSMTYTVRRGDLRVTLTEQGVLSSTDNTEKIGRAHV